MQLWCGLTARLRIFKMTITALMALQGTPNKKASSSKVVFKCIWAILRRSPVLFCETACLPNNQCLWSSESSNCHVVSCVIPSRFSRIAFPCRLQDHRVQTLRQVSQSRTSVASWTRKPGQQRETSPTTTAAERNSSLLQETSADSQTDSHARPRELSASWQRSREHWGELKGQNRGKTSAYALSSVLYSILYSELWSSTAVCFAIVRSKQLLNMVSRRPTSGQL